MIALVLAATVAWPAPLKTIVNVRSRPLCTTLAENVFGAVEGLRADDKLVDQSQTLLGRFARGTSNAMDRMRLERLSLEIVNNLQRVDALLADARRFRSPPVTDDDRAALALKAQLDAVVKQQKGEVNVLYGLADSMDMNDLQNAGDANMARAIANNSAPAIAAPAGSPPPSPGLPPFPGAPNAPALTAPQTAFGNNAYSSLMQIVAQYQSLTQSAETPAAATISAIAARCKSP